jgi:uncharacterized protein (DUF58 family)
MILRVLPGRTAIWLLAAAAAAVLVVSIIGVPAGAAGWFAGSVLVTLIAAAVVDVARTRTAWLASKIAMSRRLPAAFAIGARRQVQLQIDATAGPDWHCAVYDHTDPTIDADGLPLSLTLAPRTRVEATYAVVPTQRGEVAFAPADVRVRSRWGLCELRERLGVSERRRVYPDFGQVARYAWLAGDRRLQEIGIKTYQQRGSGTDFKQLSEYRVGDAVRHIDWKATQRMGKPIVREFQDERDQCVMLLVDCGRRMRADDRQGRIGTTHFDQVLNAVMLLSYVALKQGDAVGAMTFGTPAGQERSVMPRKGAQSLNALMAELFDVQPTPTHSDYLAAAQDLLRRQHKRSLIIVITNFRDEDSAELRQALRLLRSRHLVLLASLRERIVGELIGQPLTSGDAALDVASAHLYEQSRRDAFNRLAARDALMVDAEPERLGIELVNRYHAVKRSGLF